MTDTGNAVLQGIMDVLFDKETTNRHPAHALSIEVARLTGMPLREVDAAAMQLEAQGLISIGKGLNYNYFKLK